MAGSTEKSPQGTICSSPRTEFVAQLDAVTEPSSVKVVLTIIRQQPEVQFVAAFMTAFVSTDWLTSGLLREWPS